MESATYAQISKGTFLISSPDMDTGFFSRSVILICEHTPTGSFGLVINKNIELELPEEVIELDQLANPNIDFRAGGPLQTNQMMILHASYENKDRTLEIAEGVLLGGDLQFLQESITNENGPAIRLFFGYTGWAAGQLEREFLNGNWFVCPGTAKHLFETPTEKVWQSVLREMGGKYATLSMIPEDLSLN